MALEPVHYFIDKKNAHHGEAIAKGFGARKVPPDSLQPGNLHLIGGLQHGSLELMQQVRQMGEPYIFFDRAYFGGGPGTNRLRATRNAYQHNWITARPVDRFINRRIDLKPWRKDGSHILVIPPGDAISYLFKLGAMFAMMPAWLERTTGRPVIVSRKGAGHPAAHYFADAWCVVTWTSNVAVEAICAGVPAFTSQYSAAAPVAGNLDSMEWQIAVPPMPDRGGWARSLAYGEFDLSEIESGYARSVVMEDLPP